jgi:hypothetical protein
MRPAASGSIAPNGAAAALLRDPAGASASGLLSEARLKETRG